MYDFFFYFLLAPRIWSYNPFQTPPRNLRCPYNQIGGLILSETIIIKGITYLLVIHPIGSNLDTLLFSLSNLTNEEHQPDLPPIQREFDLQDCDGPLREIIFLGDDDFFPFYSLLLRYDRGVEVFEIDFCLKEEHEEDIDISLTPITKIDLPTPIMSSSCPSSLSETMVMVDQQGCVWRWSLEEGAQSTNQSLPQTPLSLLSNRNGIAPSLSMDRIGACRGSSPHHFYISHQSCLFLMDGRKRSLDWVLDLNQLTSPSKDRHLTALGHHPIDPGLMMLGIDPYNLLLFDERAPGELEGGSHGSSLDKLYQKNFRSLVPPPSSIRFIPSTSNPGQTNHQEFSFLAYNIGEELAICSFTHIPPDM